MSLKGSRSMVLAAVGLLLVALNLRAGVASVGPVMGFIREDLGLDAAAASLLTAIPVFAFGVFSFLAPVLTARLGRHRLIGVALVVLTAGILLRLAPSVAALFVGTVLVGAAIAIGNVTVPAVVKQDFPRHGSMMMGLYSVTLSLSATLAFAFTAPITEAAGGRWRIGLGVWAVVAVVAFVAWLPNLRRAPAGPRAGAGLDEARLARLVRNPTAVAVTLFMGTQSLGFYAMLTWAPTIFVDAGVDATTAGLLLAYSTLPSMAAALVVPTLAARRASAGGWVLAAVGLLVVAYVGMIVAPVGGAWVWMTLMGAAQGTNLALALSFIVWRSPDAHVTGQLSTLAQGVGYAIAGCGPLIMGALATATGGWGVPVGFLLAVLAVHAWFGVRAAQPTMVSGPDLPAADRAG